jgi:protein gp37
MSDLLHPDVPDTFINQVLEVMRETPRHTYQLLTKRSQRLRRSAAKFRWPDNLWVGVSVESAAYRFRIDHLREVPISTRFLSLEPLIASVGRIDLTGIHWVIVGGESGPHARSIEYEWVVDIRDQCLASNVPFFFKQWGGRTPKAGGRELDGALWDEMPTLAAG